MMNAAPVDAAANRAVPEQSDKAKTAERKSALLFAPPPLPPGPYVTLLEGEGYDVLLAQGRSAVESLLRSSSPELILAIAPTLGQDVLKLWEKMAPKAEIRVIPGLAALVQERVAPPNELLNFTIRVFSVLSGIVAERQGMPRTRTAQVLELAETAAKALGFNARERVMVSLSAALSGIAETIHLDGTSDQNATVVPGKTLKDRRKVLADFSQAMGCPFSLGTEPPSRSRPFPAL